MYVNADGTVLPCCIADHHEPTGSVQQNTIQEVWNSESYKTIRKNMLEGKDCKECRACYRNEDNGIKSFRQDVNQRFAKHLHLKDKTNADGSLDVLDLKYFDVRWSNICNFKCRSCSSTYSSSWAKEDNKDKVFIFAGGTDNDKLYQQFEPYFSEIEEFYFAGGEPLLTDKHYDILNYLIANNKTDVKLRYNTNLSNLKYKSQSVIEMWKKFKHVDVYVSLDSWDTRAEYIREGTVWSEVESNILLIKNEAPHVNLQMSTVVSAFNVSTIPEFIEYLKNKNLFLQNNFYPSFYNIMNPECYSFSIFTEEEKNRIIEKLETVNYSTHINKLINQVISTLKNTEYNKNSRQQFIKQTAYYDNKRNQNFVTTFPEIAFLNESLF